MFFSKVGRSFVGETEWRKTLTAGGAFAIFMNWLVKLTKHLVYILINMFGIKNGKLFCYFKQQKNDSRSRCHEISLTTGLV